MFLRTLKKSAECLYGFAWIHVFYLLFTNYLHWKPKVSFFKNVLSPQKKTNVRTQRRLSITKQRNT